MSRTALRQELAALLVLAVPMALTQGGQALMGVVDVAVLGHAGQVALTATHVGNSLYFGLAIFGMGVMHGLDPLVAQALGAGDPVRARRLVWQGLWLALGLTVTLGPAIALAPRGLVAFGALAGRALGVPLGITPEVAGLAERFVLWRLPSLPFFFGYFALRAYLQGHGRVRPLVVAVVAANVLNLGGDLLLVFGGAGLPGWAGPLRSIPAMGVAGAALSTALCSVLQAAVLAAGVRALTRVNGCSPAGEPARPASPRPAWRPDPHALGLALRVGLPAGLHMFAEVSFFALASILSAAFGTAPGAAHAIALQVASLTFTVATGVGNAGSVRVARAVGARDREGARRAGVAALVAGGGYMACTALVLLTLPWWVARAMTDDPAILAIAVPLLRVAACFQLFDGLQGVGAGVLRGAGETRFTFLANMVAYWVVGLPVTLALVSWVGLGVFGLWAGFVVSLAVVAACLVWRFHTLSSREIAPLASAVPPA
jgi:MATE family multidrug resistance protein